ncbi:MAG: DoxX family protein [Candidatus Acidiferrales bacterium]
MQSLERLRPLALLLLRLGLGIVLVYHGYPKLFTKTQAAIQGFEHMGFPPYFAYIAGVVEFFGGLMLIFGLFTRIAGLLIAGEMAVAIWRVYLPQGDILQIKNYEFPLVMAVSAFTLACIGAGVISMDQAIFREGRRAPRKPKEN